jgi:hypothetical protein
MRQLELTIRTWGGRRRVPVASRTPATLGSASRRAPHVARCPAHVTLRAVSNLPSLRDERTFVAIRARSVGHRSPAFACSSSARRPTICTCWWKPTTRHASSAACAGSPSGSLRRSTVRSVASDGFGVTVSSRRLLRTPREMRNALRLRAQQLAKTPARSAWIGCEIIGSVVFGMEDAVDARGRSPVARARTWLATVGWRRAGRLLDVDERAVRAKKTDRHVESP